MRLDHGTGAVIFYLGVHRPDWLAKAGVPLFVSRRVLEGRRRFPRAAGLWIEDSGAFTEITLNGSWTLSPEDYARSVRHHASEIGMPEAIGIQDWMCEPVLLKCTGLSIAEHQRRTVENFLALREINPEMPWLPTLQGWSFSDYQRCIDLYYLVGIDLQAEPLVGIGTICKRQHTAEIASLANYLAGLRIKTHGFGVKTLGLRAAWSAFTSVDSMAWSYRARHAPPLPGCSHRNCANCLRFALHWRERLLSRIGGPVQKDLFPWDTAV